MRTIAVLLLAVGLLGCARHVVFTPEVAASRNQDDWEILSEPRPAEEDPR